MYSSSRLVTNRLAPGQRGLFYLSLIELNYLWPAVSDSITDSEVGQP